MYFLYVVLFSRQPIRPYMVLLLLLALALPTALCLPEPPDPGPVPCTFRYNFTALVLGVSAPGARFNHWHDLRYLDSPDNPPTRCTLPLTVADPLCARRSCSVLFSSRYITSHPRPSEGAWVTILTLPELHTSRDTPLPTLRTAVTDPG